MLLTVNALVRYRRGLHLAVDGLASASASASEGDGLGRFFVPGQLPCGECPLCRRGFVGACQARRQVLPLTEGEAGLLTIDLPDRFVTAIDQPPGLGALDDQTAALAGVVASALFALAAVGAAPGDQATWLGGGAIAAAGVDLSRARGLKPSPAPGTPASDPLSGHGRSQPLIFVTATDLPTLCKAAALAEPGGAMVLMSDGAVTLPEGFTLPSDSRLLLQGGYHPDLVPEALAALRRGELESPATQAEVAFQPLS